HRSVDLGHRGPVGAAGAVVEHDVLGQRVSAELGDLFLVAAVVATAALVIDDPSAAGELGDAVECAAEPERPVDRHDLGEQEPGRPVGADRPTRREVWACIVGHVDFVYVLAGGQRFEDLVRRSAALGGTVQCAAAGVADERYGCGRVAGEGVHGGQVVHDELSGPVGVERYGPGPVRQLLAERLRPCLLDGGHARPFVVGGRGDVARGQRVAVPTGTVVLDAEQVGV